jgi:hypothetical protein
MELGQSSSWASNNRVGVVWPAAIAQFSVCSGEGVYFLSYALRDQSYGPPLKLIELGNPSLFVSGSTGAHWSVQKGRARRIKPLVGLAK